MPPSDQWSKVPDLNMRGSEADSGDELEYDYAKLLAERAFDFHNSPAKPDPLIKLNGKTICTPGNISNIQASAKAGKTSVIGGILAAVCVGERRGRDTFGFEAYNRFQHAVLHFDTEQSSFDHNANIHQALKRADVKEPPPWFHSYCLTGIDPDDIEKSVMCALDLAAQKHGGVFLVVIDGIADLCSNPNDATDAFRLVAELQRAAITHNCAILTVLHENPGRTTAKPGGTLAVRLNGRPKPPCGWPRMPTAGLSPSGPRRHGIA